MADLVLRNDANGLAVLTLNRPERLNTLTVALFTDLLRHLEDIAAGVDRIGCVLLRGNGRCFSAGHDLNDIAAGEAPPRPNFQGDVIERLAGLPQPVIVAVHSYCMTGALELALAGDIILAAENAVFADTHAKWALTPIWGMSQRLPRRVGSAQAVEMMMTCRQYSAREAAAMGLVNRVLPVEPFEAEVERYAREILVNSWFSLRANKRLLCDTACLPLAAGLAHEFYRSEGVGPDMQERIAAFKQRKKS